MSVSPATPLGPHLALPNRVLIGRAGPYPTLHRPDRALLRYDFAVQSEAIGCSLRSFPPGLRPLSAGPFRVTSQSQFFPETLTVLLTSQLCVAFNY